MSDNAANETGNYIFTLPDGLVIKYLKDGWRKHGCKYPNVMDDFLFVMYPEVESRIRYLNLKPGDIMIDVGACIGSWTIHAALLGAHVHAFEMGESQLKALDYNLRLNNIQDRVTVHDTALQADDTQEMLFDGIMQMRSRPVIESCIKAASLKQIPKESIIYTDVMKPVKSTTLDNWMKENRDSVTHIELIKIDIEGMELEVLHGALHTIREFIPNLVVEIHDNDNPQLRIDIEKFLKDLGYKQKRVPGLNDYFYQP